MEAVAPTERARSHGWPGRVGQRLLGPVVRKDTWLSVAFLVLTAPLAVISVPVVVAGLIVGLLVGAAAAPIGLGGPVLLGVLGLVVRLADLDRRLVNTLLGGAVPAPPDAGDRALLSGSRTWRALAWLVLRGVTGLVVLLAAAVAAVTLAALVALPFVEGYLSWGDSWHSRAGVASAWAPLLAVAVAVGLLQLARAGGAAHRLAAESLLVPEEREQLAELEAEAGSLQERARLAREVHDGIGHALTVIVLQAEAGRAGLVTDQLVPDLVPDQQVRDQQVRDQQGSGVEAADRALRTIADAGRRALDDLDAVLAALGPDDVGPVRPGPGLSALPELVERARAAGLPVRAEVAAAAVAHPAGPVGYRIVQEACTNAMRHAGRAPTVVRVSTSSGWLDVDVHNVTGPADHGLPAAGGRGLAGLAERVRLAGGEWSAGPAPDGGWRVSARLPPGPG